MQYSFSSFVSTLDLESRKVVPDVVPVRDSTSFESVLHIRDGLENLTLLHTLQSHLRLLMVSKPWQEVT
jgi:hypothetical protein